MDRGSHLQEVWWRTFSDSVFVRQASSGAQSQKNMINVPSKWSYYSKQSTSLKTLHRNCIELTSTINFEDIILSTCVPFRVPLQDPTGPKKIKKRERWLAKRFYRQTFWHKTIIEKRFSCTYFPIINEKYCVFLLIPCYFIFPTLDIRIILPLM